ncbi:MAG: BON domain-containing protein [Burkholderiaceae bacterium]
MTDKRNLARPLAAALLCAMLAGSLQGCVGLVMGGAVAGTMAATDRRTLGAQTEDKAIAVKGESRVSSLFGDRAHINVTSYNRKVLLTGEVPDETAKATAQREVSGIEGVESIYNELAVAPTPSLGTRSNDTFITSKIKASFIDAHDIFANSIKVVTERGVVYLMGLVTQREGTRAASIASGVSGVQRVVKLFEYISEEELQRLSTTPQPSDSNSKTAR